jgi:hypothetical protein
MVLSDHLDMVGVELKASHTQTRKVNGDALQSRVKNIVGPWRSGRFMPLTQRPWSINSYALSKVWYECNSVHLRLADISSITSKVKSWLYADQFEKPEELILYRPSTHGGLGMHHVEVKALAILIRSFLETAVNPKFLHNLYHSSLYKCHVLLQQDTPDPGHENTTMNVATMSSSGWYNVLVENNCTMHASENSTSTSSYLQELNLPGLRMTGVEPGDWQDRVLSGQRYQLSCGDSSIISYQLKKEQAGLSVQTLPRSGS